MEERHSQKGKLRGLVAEIVSRESPELFGEEQPVLIRGRQFLPSQLHAENSEWHTESEKAQ